jgi:hypothetical protein
LLEAPSSAAAAIPAARALVRFVHLERTTLEVFRVELLDRLLSLGVRTHFDETEAFRLAGIAVVDDGNRLAATDLAEQLLQVVGGDAVAKIPNVKLSSYGDSPLR